MTQNRDFKRLVRARMAKTGESYTTARAHLAEPSNVPTPDEYADLAGMSDVSVQRKTDKTWLQWVETLDPLGAQGMSHTEIAALVGDRWPEIGMWWAQSVTVGYERIRGLRSKGQLCSGDFAASKSKTFPVPVATLYAAFAAGQRAAWMGEEAEERTHRVNHSMRLSWPDGTVVTVGFTDKGPHKSSVAIQHMKLESAERRSLEKERWAERFTALAAMLS